MNHKTADHREDEFMSSGKLAGIIIKRKVKFKSSNSKLIVP